MAFLDWKKCNCLFHTLCLVATIGLQIYCIYKYTLNEDVSLVTYKRFHAEKDNVYPSISFCIINPFLEDELQKYGNNISVTSYSYFLQGWNWDERMMNIDFDSVTVSLADNLNWMAIQLHNDAIYFFDNLKQKSVPTDWNPPKFYVSFRSSLRKCFSFDVPSMDKDLVKDFYLAFKTTMFPKGVRPVKTHFDGSNPDDGGGFFTYLHYPGQRFTSYYTVMSDWKSRVNNTKNYYMRFDAKDIEVIRHRNKAKQRCVEDWRNYDQMIMNDIIQEVGCRPPHWNTTLDLSLCSTPGEMQYFKDQPTTAKVQSFDPPCNVIESIRYSYFEDDYPTQTEGIENGSFLYVLKEIKIHMINISTFIYNLNSLPFLDSS